MATINNVEPVHEREARIASSSRLGLRYPVIYKSQRHELEICRVPISTPIYRTSNMRTSVKQLELISSRQLSNDFFSNGQENLETQRLQHEILLEMSKDSGADIYSVFRQGADQTDPLLTTTTGIVVNGNRRLAAMRELYASDPTRYGKFGYVEVAVLPADADEDVLSEIETKLQITPDLRSDYGWVEIALGLRHQRERGWQWDRASAVWGETEAELKERLEQLSQAEAYLDYLGRPGEYKLVSDDEQAIKTFSKNQTQRIQTASPSRLEFERLLMFAILQNRDLADRKYNYAKDIEKIAREVEKSIAVDGTQRDTTYDPDDLLSELPPQSDEIHQELLDLARDKDYAEELSEKAESALIDIKARASAARKGQSLLVGAKEAHKKLSPLSLTNSDQSTYLGAAKTLILVLSESARLLELLVKEDDSIPSQIDLAFRNTLKPVVSAINKLNSLAK